MFKKPLLVVPVMLMVAAPALAQFTQEDLRKRDLNRPRCSATVTDNCRTWGPRTAGVASATEVSTGAQNDAREAGSSAAVYRDGDANDPTNSPN